MEEKRAVFVCSGCGDDICAGDTYYDILGEQFCEHCIERSKERAVFIDETE